VIHVADNYENTPAVIGAPGRAAENCTRYGGGTAEAKVTGFGQTQREGGMERLNFFVLSVARCPPSSRVLPSLLSELARTATDVLSALCT